MSVSAENVAGQGHRVHGRGLEKGGHANHCVALSPVGIGLGFGRDGQPLEKSRSADGAGKGDAQPLSQAHGALPICRAHGDDVRPGGHLKGPVVGLGNGRLAGGGRGALLQAGMICSSHVQGPARGIGHESLIPGEGPAHRNVALFACQGEAGLGGLGLHGLIEGDLNDCVWRDVLGLMVRAYDDDGGDLSSERPEKVLLEEPASDISQAGANPNGVSGPGGEPVAWRKAVYRSADPGSLSLYGRRKL